MNQIFGALLTIFSSIVGMVITYKITAEVVPDMLPWLITSWVAMIIGTFLVGKWNQGV